MLFNRKDLEGTILVTMPTMDMEGGMCKALTGRDYTFMPGEIIKVNFSDKEEIIFGFRRDYKYLLECLQLGIQVTESLSVGQETTQKSIGPYPIKVEDYYLNDMYFQEYFGKDMFEVMLDYFNGKEYTQKLYQIGHQILLTKLAFIGGPNSELIVKGEESYEVKVSLPKEDDAFMQSEYESLVLGIIIDESLSELIKYTEININKVDESKIGSMLLTRATSYTEMIEIVSNVDMTVTLNNINSIKLDRKLNKHLPLIYQYGGKFKDRHVVVKTNNTPEDELKIKESSWFFDNPTKIRLKELINYIPEYNPKEEVANEYTIQDFPIIHAESIEEVSNHIQNNTIAFENNVGKVTNFYRNLINIPKVTKSQYLKRLRDKNYLDAQVVLNENFNNVRDNISREVWVTDSEIMDDYVIEKLIGPTITELKSEFVSARGNLKQREVGIQFKKEQQLQKFMNKGITVEYFYKSLFEKSKVKFKEKYQEVELINILEYHEEDVLMAEFIKIVLGDYENSLIYNEIVENMVTPLHLVTINEFLFENILIDDILKPSIDIKLRKMLMEDIQKQLEILTEPIHKILPELKSLNKKTLIMIFDIMLKNFNRMDGDN